MARPRPKTSRFDARAWSVTAPSRINLREWGFSNLRHYMCSAERAALSCALQAARSRISSIAPYWHVPPPSAGNAGGAVFEFARARPDVVDSATPINNICSQQRRKEGAGSVFPRDKNSGGKIILVIPTKIEASAPLQPTRKLPPQEARDDLPLNLLSPIFQRS